MHSIHLRTRLSQPSMQVSMQSLVLRPRQYPKEKAGHVDYLIIKVKRWWYWACLADLHQFHFAPDHDDYELLCISTDDFMRACRGR